VCEGNFSLVVAGGQGGRPLAGSARVERELFDGELVLEEVVDERRKQGHVLGQRIVRALQRQWPTQEIGSADLTMHTREHVEEARRNQRGTPTLSPTRPYLASSSKATRVNASAMRAVRHDGILVACRLWTLLAVLTASPPSIKRVGGREGGRGERGRGSDGYYFAVRAERRVCPLHVSVRKNFA